MLCLEKRQLTVCALGFGGGCAGCRVSGRSYQTMSYPVLAVPTRTLSLRSCLEIFVQPLSQVAVRFESTIAGLSFVSKGLLGLQQLFPLVTAAVNLKPSTCHTIIRNQGCNETHRHKPRWKLIHDHLLLAKALGNTGSLAPPPPDCFRPQLLGEASPW